MATTMSHTTNNLISSRSSSSAISNTSKRHAIYNEFDIQSLLSGTALHSFYDDNSSFHSGTENDEEEVSPSRCSSSEINYSEWPSVVSSVTDFGNPEEFVTDPSVQYYNYGGAVKPPELIEAMGLTWEPPVPQSQIARVDTEIHASPASQPTSPTKPKLREAFTAPLQFVRRTTSTTGFLSRQNSAPGFLSRQNSDTSSLSRQISAESPSMSRKSSMSQWTASTASTNSSTTSLARFFTRGGAGKYSKPSPPDWTKDAMGIERRVSVYQESIYEG